MANQECCGGYYVAKALLDEEKKIAPISDRTSVTDMLDLCSIPCLAFSNKKGQREHSTVSGRQDVAA